MMIPFALPKFLRFFLSLTITKDQYISDFYYSRYTILAIPYTISTATPYYYTGSSPFQDFTNVSRLHLLGLMSQLLRPARNFKSIPSHMRGSLAGSLAYVWILH